LTHLNTTLETYKKKSKQAYRPTQKPEPQEKLGTMACEQKKKNTKRPKEKKLPNASKKREAKAPNNWFLKNYP